MCLNMSSGKWQPFCLGLYVLRVYHIRCWSYSGLFEELVSTIAVDDLEMQLKKKIILIFSKPLHLWGVEIFLINRQDQLILHSQQHGCRCPSDTLVLPEYFNLTTRVESGTSHPYFIGTISKCLHEMLGSFIYLSLQWRHDGHDSVSNHQPHDCFLNRLFRRRSKKTSKLRVTGLCARWIPYTNGQ